jgi:sugar phosphate isomerase/epimerase
MKIGCCAYSYRKYLTSGQMSLEEFVDIASDLGIEGVELTSYYFPSTDAAYLHSLKRHCMLRGVSVSGAAVGSKLTLASDEERAAEVRTVKEWLGHARELGAPELRVFAGITPEGHTDEEAFGWAVAALKECVPVAEEAGVVMALENHGGITTTSAQVIALIEAVDSPWLQVNLDTGNYGLDPDVDPYEGMRRVAALSVTAHHKVSMRTPDGSKRVDVTQVVSTLRAADYRGFLNIEFEEDDDPMTGVPLVVEEIRSALASA